MQNLLKNNAHFFVGLLVISGCTTSHFKVTKQTEGRVEFSVTPDRIVLECEDVQDPSVKPDEDGRYGFLLRVLDDRDSVISMHQKNILGKKHCFDRIETINKMLNRAKSVYIGGWGDMKDSPSENVFYADFPKRGRFRVGGKTVAFGLLMTDAGDCFDAFNETDKPCPKPDENFPIR